MATLEELESALIKADAAGNAEDARVFAGEIRRLRADSKQNARNLPEQAQRDSQGLPLSQEQKQAAAETQESPDKGGLSNFLTGADRKVPGVDELNPDKVFGGPFNMENFKTSAGTLMTFDDDAQKNIWDEQLSSAGVEHRWEQDPFGNAVLVYKDEDGEEQMGYLNKPGVSGRDIAATGAQVGGFIGLGRLAQAAPGVGSWLSNAGLFGRTAAGAAAGAGQSAATDAGANAVGADIPGEDIAQNAALGAGLGAGATLLGSGVQGMLKGMAEKSALKKQIAQQIYSGSGDTQTARYMLKGADRLAKDPSAKAAIKQGFDEGVVATVKGASPADRQKMRRMVSLLEQGKKNQRFSVLNRPSDVVGDSLVERFKAVRSINRRAGNQLDFEAKKLRGQPVDVSGVMDDFVRTLEDDLGVTVVNGKPSFAGSTIEGLDGPQKFLTRLLGRLRNSEASPDAYDVHRMKKFIDEQVTFGKTAEGLGGKTERVAKGLRRQFDQLLDSSFPAYDKVNTQYADTVQALDAFQKAAGSTIDLASENADKAVGTLSRRLMSNAQSRVRLLDAIEGLQSTASKYGKTFDDDVVSQALFVDELERVFGPSARTSLQGEVGKGVRYGADLMTGETRNVLVDAASKAIEKARGVNEENAISSIKQVLQSVD